MSDNVPCVYCSAGDELSIGGDLVWMLLSFVIAALFWLYMLSFNEHFTWTFYESV